MEKTLFGPGGCETTLTMQEDLTFLKTKMAKGKSGISESAMSTLNHVAPMNTFYQLNELQLKKKKNCYVYLMCSTEQKSYKIWNKTQITIKKNR